MLAVKWAVENGLLPENTKCLQGTGNAEKWLKRIETLLELGTSNDCIKHRPDLKLEVTSKKTILLIDMACPNENKKIDKRDKKIGKYNRLYFESWERRGSNSKGESNSNNY